MSMPAPLDYDALFEIGPYALGAGEKAALFDAWIPSLSLHHKTLCPEYARICAALGDAPALPVRLFKEYTLRSVEDGAVSKTMASSGTTGQRRSMIYLDRATSARQTKALAKIVSSFVGRKRPPLLVIDSPATVKDRAAFTARGAGIRGFSMLGRDVSYALDDNMALDYGAVGRFASEHAGERVMLFGFTYIIWQQFVQELARRDAPLALEGILIHGGGWKKLADQAVDNETFKRAVTEACGIGTVCDYYGMVEQTGSIFMECECGHLHASLFSDIDFVSPYTFETLGVGARGLAVTTSLLPTSYPGHVLLTEDEGELLGIDDCPCGRRGKYFRIFGRLPGAEIRGCSDTYERR